MSKITASLILVMMIVFLCSCKNSIESSPTSTPSASPATIEAPVADDVLVFSFEEAVISGLPAFKFEIYESEAGKLEFFPYTYIVRISCPVLSEWGESFTYAPQELSIHSADRWHGDNMERIISLVDIDFDGCNDIQVATISGVANVSYSFYRWNYFSGSGYGSFEDTPFFSLLSSGYSMYPETKQIVNSSRINARSHLLEMYQLENTRNSGWLGAYNLIRSAVIEVITYENDECSFTLQVYFGDEEIYAETAPVTAVGEYIISSMSENYLRFGVEHPTVASPEAAASLAYQKYGYEDIETGYMLSFNIFDEMFIHEGLSCFKMRRQWFVDESHWTTIGFIGVTPYGDVFDVG